MTPPPQQRKEANRYLEAFDFSGLFTDPSIGWDWPDSGPPLRVPFGGDFIALQHIAQKKGVRILLVPPPPDGSIMPSDERKKLEKIVTPLATEHLLIFVNKVKTRQIWLWTSRLPGKPVRHRELTWEKGHANENLLQKLTTIAFTLDEEEGLDITGVVQRLRDNLDRDRLTRRFYDDFKRHKDQFQEFIKGISDSGILAHYTSLMLNRLMFCYFLQQKGFLNGEQDYLYKRLDTVPATLGKNKFHSFYRSFLKRLFFDGLDKDTKTRPAELVALIGENIPYLNGGIFAEHPIERAHPGIVIPDDAFKKSSTSSTTGTGISMTARSAMTARSTPRSSATSSRNTPTRRRWGPTTPRRTSPNTSAKTPSCLSCSKKRPTNSRRWPGIS